MDVDSKLLSKGLTIRTAPGGQEEEENRRLDRFFKCIVDLIHVFVLLLDYKGIASLYILFPQLRKVLCNHFNMQQHLRRLPGPGLRVEIFTEPFISEFVALSHFYEHAEQSFWKNENRVLGRELDGFSPFLVDCPPNRSGRLSAMCFLRPSSPSPFQNGLLVCDSSKCLSLYAMEKDRFRIVLDTETEYKIAKVACSPRGKCVALLDSFNVLSLLLLKSGEATLVYTNVAVRPSAIRREMFMSETELLLEDENWVCWMYSFHPGASYSMTKRRLDERCPSRMDCLPRGGRVAYVPAMENVPEVVIYKTRCSRFEHSMHELVFCLKPREKASQGGKRRKKLHFDECIIVDYHLDSVYRKLWIVVLTMANKADFLGTVVLGVDRYGNRCKSKFARMVCRIGVYEVCMVELEAGNLFARPRFFASHNTCIPAAMTYTTSWRWYKSFAEEQSKRIVVALSDRFILVKMFDAVLYLFPVAAVPESVFFRVMVSPASNLLASTAESNYLAVWSDVNPTFGHLTVMRFCPLYPTLTIEEATRCRSIPPNVRFEKRHLESNFRVSEEDEEDPVWTWRTEEPETYESVRTVDTLLLLLQIA